MMARVTKRARILMVDDEARLAAWLRRALAFEGDAGSVADDGRAALAAVHGVTIEARDHEAGDALRTVRPPAEPAALVQ
jgi:hypothetical protein